MHSFDGLRHEFELPDEFPADVLAEAEAIGAQPIDGNRVDLTDVAFVTIDPPGSMDLDQAVCLTTHADGWRIRYAIADVGSVIRPGSVLDAESRRRGQTVYLPDGRVPLYPTTLSEGALSLLPDQTRRAAVWTVDVAPDGSIGTATVVRAVVRSVARLDYDGVQADFDAGRPHPSLTPMLDLGLARRAHRIGDGATDLGIPEQDVRRAGTGWELRWRNRPAVEGANAEISLLTGMAAARLMLDAGVGLLRTLPPADPDDVRQFLARARACGVDADSPADVIEALHGANLGHLALMYDAAGLLRGAGYAAFDGTAPELRTHAGIGGPYAHVTAPLRRLADRFGTEICLAVSAGSAVAADIRTALDDVADTMKESDGRASRVERAACDQVEAWSVSVGQRFSGVCVRCEDGRATVALHRPAVIADSDGSGVVAGQRVEVEVADVSGRVVTFRPAAK